MNYHVTTSHEKCHDCASLGMAALRTAALEGQPRIYVKNGHRAEVILDPNGIGKAHLTHVMRHPSNRGRNNLLTVVPDPTMIDPASRTLRRLPPLPMDSSDDR